MECRGGVVVLEGKVDIRTLRDLEIPLISLKYTTLTKRILELFSELFSSRKRSIDTRT